MNDYLRYQFQLQKNLIFLATIADCQPTGNLSAMTVRTATCLFIFQTNSSNSDYANLQPGSIKSPLQQPQQQMVY